MSFFFLLRFWYSLDSLSKVVVYVTNNKCLNNVNIVCCVYVIFLYKSVFPFYILGIYRRWYSVWRQIFNFRKLSFPKPTRIAYIYTYTVHSYVRQESLFSTLYIIKHAKQHYTTDTVLSLSLLYNNNAVKFFFSSFFLLL